MSIPHRLLPDCIIWKRKRGVDSYGKPTYYPEEPLSQCRYEPSQKTIFGPDSELTVRRGVAFFGVPPHPPLSVDDVLILPDGTAPRVLTVEMLRDASGRVHHIEVEYG